MPFIIHLADQYVQIRREQILFCSSPNAYLEGTQHCLLMTHAKSSVVKSCKTKYWATERGRSGGCCWHPKPSNKCLNFNQANKFCRLQSGRPHSLQKKKRQICTGHSSVCLFHLWIYSHFIKIIFTLSVAKMHMYCNLTRS